MKCEQNSQLQIEDKNLWIVLRWTMISQEELTSRHNLVKMLKWEERWIVASDLQLRAGRGQCLLLRQVRPCQLILKFKISGLGNPCKVFWFPVTQLLRTNHQKYSTSRTVHGATYMQISVKRSILFAHCSRGPIFSPGLKPWRFTSTERRVYYYYSVYSCLILKHKT